MFDEPKRSTRPPRKTIVTFHVDTHEYWALEQAARNTGRSMSAFIRHAIGQVITSKIDQPHEEPR